MFPLRAVDKGGTSQSSKTPVVTRLIIGLNILAFLFQLFGGRDAALIAGFGVRPHCYLSPGACGIDLPAQAERLWQPLLASLFLHAGLLHIGFNMLFLSVFGPGLEHRLGRLRFLVFYMACGVAASLAHIATHPFSTVPAIGASGAISGVLGAYFILLTRAWILTYFPPIFFFPVPAPLFLVAWIAFQIISCFFSGPLLPGARESNVAWTAHIGGFAMGAAWAWTIKPWWKKKPEKKKKPARTRAV